jgi:hypothetical protein
LIRATAEASTTTAGTLMDSLIALALLDILPDAPHGGAVAFRQDNLAGGRIDDGLFDVR